MSPRQAVRTSKPFALPVLVAALLSVPAWPAGCASVDQDVRRTREILARERELARDGVSEQEKPEFEALLAEFNEVAARVESKLDGNAALLKKGADSAAPFLPEPLGSAAHPIGELLAFGYLLLRGNGVKAELKKARDVINGLTDQSAK